MAGWQALMVVSRTKDDAGMDRPRGNSCGGVGGVAASLQSPSGNPNLLSAIPCASPTGNLPPTSLLLCRLPYLADSGIPLPLCCVPGLDSLITLILRIGHLQQQQQHQ